MDNPKDRVGEGGVGQGGVDQHLFSLVGYLFTYTLACATSVTASIFTNM
jgi:hypothetical protein